jgi:AcrR family transcriptional regulator
MSRDRDLRDRLEDYTERQIEKALSKRMGRSLERRLAREAAAAIKKGAKLSREQIAAAALAIADAQGFEAVSMRKIAAVLGSGTMSLYHYVRTKDDLVAVMDDAIMGEVLVPTEKLPSHWRQALTTIAHRTRDVFARHSWAMTALMQARPGPNGMKHVEQSLAALKNTDLEPEEKFTVLTMVDDYVFGHTLRSNARRNMAIGEKEPVTKTLFEATMAELATGNYPELTAVVGDDPEIAFKQFGESAREARFETGLEAILDGAAAKFGLP